MASKADAKESKEAAPEKAPAPAAASGGGAKSWLPAIVAVILAPAASFAVAQFLLLPKLKEQLGAPPPAGEHAEAHPPAEAAPAEGGHGKKKGGHGGKEEEGAAENYEFSNVVVNLAGTMGTRYLKTSFIVTGVNGTPTKTVFDNQKAKLTDITLNVLSSLSLADLEEPGSKNILREKLVAAYNQALGKRVVDQVYFSDFVIQ